MIAALTNEADGFAIAMIAVMACSFGFLGVLLATILRNATKRNREVEDLIEEVTREEPKEKAPAGKSAEPWERDGDWWKK